MRLFFTACLALALGCGGDDPANDVDEHDDEDEHEDETGVTCPDDLDVTYEGFVQPFMEKYCVRCHSSELEFADRQGAPLDHNFDTLEGALEFPEHQIEVAAAGPDKVNEIMPPSGAKPSVEEREKLGQWLACVAENRAPEQLAD